MFNPILCCKIYTFTEQYFFMYLVNIIPFLRRHFYERLLDSISFTVREADLSHQWMVVRYTTLRKCLLTQWTSSLPRRRRTLHSHNHFFFIVDMLTLPTNARWSQTGVTVAGGNGQGNAVNQLRYPCGLHIDDDNQSIVIADWRNHRVVEWKIGASNGKVIAGGRGQASRLDQLNCPTDVLIDKETNSLFIADGENRRVVRWSRSQETTQGEVIVDNVVCEGLAIDHQRYLYVSDTVEDEVRRYTIGDKNGIVVAGGNARGNQLNQLNWPTYLFIDEEQAVYVSDTYNHRVMKWNKDAKEGIVVAGGQRQGSALTQLSHPRGLFVDTSGTIYVADARNNRVMRWSKGAREGTVIVGGNGHGDRTNQLNEPEALSFDRHCNLYVVDNENHRVQRFDIL